MANVLLYLSLQEWGTLGWGVLGRRDTGVGGHWGGGTLEGEDTGVGGHWGGGYWDGRTLGWGVLGWEDTGVEGRGHWGAKVHTRNDRRVTRHMVVNMTQTNMTG